MKIGVRRYLIDRFRVSFIKVNYKKIFSNSWRSATKNS